jgi:tetratricopeptide (TPR) repeat protein
VLSDVSPWGYLFKPKFEGATEWRTPTPKELENRWPKSSDRAEFMILTAANLVAINRLPEADQLLAMAVTTKRHTSLLLSTQASLAASRTHWGDAVTLASESLRKDHANQAASEILIRGLIESGRTDEALDRARDLFALDEENEETLFLLARTANAAHSSQEEIDALARLVALGRKRNQPLGVSLTYLGQAYAKSGQRGEALRTFQQAVVAPELTDEQHKIIRDIMDHLMEGNTSSTTLPPLTEGKRENEK